eukprot:TRINITY_DN25267_c0_g8_i1.p1 TRINITY_DN25267_c0_g8~~TRINITY_DN25267_c0_g8_i1.p1  ORF type:complete len:836 (-),score=146.36 TRINITY_DN25267_c0_g8_i1:130-2454(-)
MVLRPHSPPQVQSPPRRIDISGMPLVTMSELNPSAKDAMMRFLVDCGAEFFPAEGAEDSNLLFAKVRRPVRLAMRGDSSTHGSPSVTAANSLKERVREKHPENPTSSSSAKPTHRKKSDAAHAEVEADVNTMLHLQDQQSKLMKHFPEFCDYLPDMEKPLKVLTRDKLSRFIRDVYAAKYEQETRSIHRGPKKSAAASPSSPGMPDNFPYFVIDFAKKRYGMSSLVYAHCWDIAAATMVWRGKDTSIETFARFLEESYGPRELLLFLYTRNIAARLPVLVQSPSAPPASPLSSGLHTSSRAFSTQLDKVMLSAAQCGTVVKHVLAGRKALAATVMETVFSAAASPSEAGAPDALAFEELAALIVQDFKRLQESAPTTERMQMQQDAPQSGFPTLDLLDLHSVSDSPVRHSMESNVKARQSAREEKHQHSTPAARNEGGRAYNDDIDFGGDSPPVSPPLVGEYSVTVGDLQKAWHGLLHAEPVLVAKGPAVVNASATLWMPTARELNEDLEGSTHIIMAIVAKEVVLEVMNNSNEAQYQPRLFKAVSDRLLAECVPFADSLMEALVGKSFEAWQERLAVDPKESTIAKRCFERLQVQLEKVLSAEMTPQSVQMMYRAILRCEAVRMAVQRRCVELFGGLAGNAGLDSSAALGRHYPGNTPLSSPRTAPHSEEESQSLASFGTREAINSPPRAPSSGKATPPKLRLSMSLTQNSTPLTSPRSQNSGQESARERLPLAGERSAALQQPLDAGQAGAPEDPLDDELSGAKQGLQDEAF